MVVRKETTFIASPFCWMDDMLLERSDNMFWVRGHESLRGGEEAKINVNRYVDLMKDKCFTLVVCSTPFCVTSSKLAVFFFQGARVNCVNYSFGTTTTGHACAPAHFRKQDSLYTVAMPRCAACWRLSSGLFLELLVF